MPHNTDVFCCHSCGNRKSDHFSTQALQGINFAVSAALHMSKHNDPKEVRDALIAAANALFLIQKRHTMKDSMLNVDFWIFEPAEKEI